MRAVFLCLEAAYKRDRIPGGNGSRASADDGSLKLLLPLARVAPHEAPAEQQGDRPERSVADSVQVRALHGRGAVVQPVVCSLEHEGLACANWVAAAADDAGTRWAWDDLEIESGGHNARDGI